jgi:hypothetical protein
MRRSKWPVVPDDGDACCLYQARVDARLRRRRVRWGTAELKGAGILVVGVAMVSLAASARPVTYADTCVERDSGDIAGTVLTVAGRGRHPRVTISWSEGALMMPVVATATFDAPTGRLAFVARTGGHAGNMVRFKGRLRRNALAGQLSLPWESTSRPVVLPVRTIAAANAPHGCAD